MARSVHLWRRRALAVALSVIALPTGTLVAAQAATPPVVSEVRAWNQHALAALANPTNAPTPGAGQTPPVSALHLAMVQLAVYDAVTSIVGGHEPYLDGLPPASPSASVDAAVATAAHHVLVGLARGPVPSLPQAVLDRLDGLYEDSLAAIPDSSAKDDGIAAGAAVAAALLAERDGDGRYVPFQFTVGAEPGQWRPTSGINDPFAWVANVEPFTLDSASQVRTEGPREVTSRAYAKEYNEVKKLGATDSLRSPRQQALAEFFTVSPVELFNRAFRGVTEDRGLSLAQEARFFAMVNVAGADALIGCWTDKEFWGFWRPLTAIQLGDDDGNRRTAGDPTWTPFLPTPPYPDHSSGYNCATGAFMNAAKAFFDKGKVDLTLHNLATGATRDYRRFTDVVDDTIDARVYQGIHFRSADEQGARLGKEVAHWVDERFFQRVG